MSKSDTRKAFVDALLTPSAGAASLRRSASAFLLRWLESEKIDASKSLILSIKRDVSLFALSEPEKATVNERYNQTIRHRGWRGSARRP
jgi:hypothetical protein